MMGNPFRTYRELDLSLFSVYMNTDGLSYIGIMHIDTADYFDGHLLYIERDRGTWRFDFMYLRRLLNQR